MFTILFKSGMRVSGVVAPNRAAARRIAEDGGWNDLYGDIVSVF